MKLTEMDMDYPDANLAVVEMINALQAVLSSYILCTSSAQETPDMKRARTLVGIALDKARGYTYLGVKNDHNKQ